MSTTGTWSPVVGASAGDTDVAAAIAVAAAAAVAAPCCSPVAIAVPHGGPSIAAVLPAARGALDERRLVGTDISELSALAGARAGTVSVTLRTRNTRVSVGPSKSRMHGGSVVHLKLEQPHFLFLEGSKGASVVPAGTTVALAGTCSTLAGSSTDNPAAGASTPAAGASSATASAACGDGGGGFHISGGLPSVALFFLFLRR
jgi:hypothetical protein